MTRFYHNFPFCFRVNPAGNKFLSFLRPGLFLMALFLIISCEEGPTKIGSELLPGSDFVVLSSTDTISARSYTMYSNSDSTNSPSFGYIGDIYNPYFGTTTAEFVSQIRLGSAWDFGPVTIDSVKLNLYVNVQGGSEDEGHVLTLEEISDMLYTTSTYYSTTPTNTTGYSVSVQLPKITKPDSINNISVSLPVEFGEYIVRDTSQLFYSTTKPDFRSFFKGLRFKLTSTSNPLMMSFSLTSAIASGGSYNNFFVLYMHDTSFVSIRYYLILDALHPNACYNKFTHDFTTAEPDKKIEHINEYSYRDTLSYIQYLNGLYTKIVFPGLDSVKKVFSKGKFSINKARLSVPAYYDGGLYNVLTVPSNLRLRYTDKDGIKYDVPDYNMDTNHSFFGGYLNKLDSTYYFNIPTFIQRYLEDNGDNYRPELEIYQSAAILSGAILRTNTSKTPVRFELTYTKY